jgi:internalin A
MRPWSVTSDLRVSHYLNKISSTLSQSNGLLASHRTPPMRLTVLTIVALHSMLLSHLPLVAQEKQAQETKPQVPAPPVLSIFKDKALETAVRKQVFAKRETNEPLTAADVEKVAVIEGRNMGIKDLSGLEKCVQLASLTLPQNLVSDLSPLSHLERLQFIDLAENQVSDLTALGTLKSLQHIDLTGNKVAELKPLATAKTLNSLYLAGNQIKDLSPLTQLPKVWSLQLDRNQISKLDGLGNLKGLCMLSLEGNQIRDLTPLEPLAELRFLILTGNQLADLTPLKRMMEKDFAGRKQWAPYCDIRLGNNPLSADAKQIVEGLVKAGGRIQL